MRSTNVPTDERLDLRGRKLAGLSVSELITKYHKKGHDFALNEMAVFVDALNDQGYTVVLIPHVVERKFSNDDQRACMDVLRRVKSDTANVSMMGWFDGIEAKSVVGLCDVLIGARTHPTIASLSQGIPFDFCVSFSYPVNLNSVPCPFLVRA